ncbi:MAG: amidohydrolase family protein [Bacillota bacterium]|nr:amidohydrolase family protein [Bacillota bacterium]MDW7684945.1 amidohydrolase family protein [Bacillota bacterium]
MNHIDAHIHLYPETLMNAIYRYFEKLGWHLPLRPGVDDTIAHLRANNAEKAFLLLYSHKTGMSKDLNHWAHQLCLRHKELVPFGCFFPDDEKPKELVRNCLVDFGFAGFKLHFNVQPYRPDDRRYFPVYRGIMEYGGGIVMHVGTFPNSGDHLGAERLLAALQKFPKLKVMVAHMGFFQTEDFWRIMDRYPGVYLDTAFLLGNPDFFHADSVIAATLERFPDRVVYGSDFPLICHHLGDGLDHIAKLPWDQTLKRKLMYENANRFLAHIPE